MITLHLIEPTVQLETEYNQMMDEWRLTGENLVPFVLKLDTSDFLKFVDRLNGYKTGIDIPDSFVPHSTFWLINEDRKILGVVNIRHRLTDSLLLEGGHIGYGIRPLERRKGYATRILELALTEAKKLGINRALLTCNKDNTASENVILKNKGAFFQENIVDGKSTRSFWIDV